MEKGGKKKRRKESKKKGKPSAASPVVAFWRKNVVGLFGSRTHIFSLNEQIKLAYK